MAGPHRKAAAQKPLPLRAWAAAARDDIGLIAAGVAFYAFLGLIPLIAAIVLGYGLVADAATAVRHGQALFALMPDEAAQLIGQQMREIAAQSDSTAGLGVAIALAAAIFGALKSATAVILALNIVHGEPERRGFFARALVALAITAALVLVGILGLAAIAVLSLVEQLLSGAPPSALLLVRIAFWLAAGVAATLLIGLVYRFGPYGERPAWRALLPGALLATAGWLVATLGFGLYVANFGNYNATYGALGAVVVLLMWLWLSAYVLLFGAEFNDARIGSSRK